MEAVNSKLALFKPFPREMGIEAITWIEYRPTSQLTHRAPITFSIPPSPNYIDLKQTRLHVKCRILQGDGSNLPPASVINPSAEAKVGPINNLLGSLWSQVDVSLQQQVITSSVGTNYPYKAYLDTLLNNGYEAKNNQLQAQLFYKDTGLSLSDPNDPSVGINFGLTLRAEHFRESKITDLEGPLFMDICQQDHLILNGVPLDIKLYPKPEPFVLITPNPSPSYKLEITDIMLKVCMVVVSPGIIEGHSKALGSSPAQYSIHRSDIKTFSVPQGQFGLTVDDVFQGSCPQQVLVGLVSSSAYSGSYATNPFNFKHYKCNFAAFYVDGQSVPARPLQPDFQANNYIDAYISLVTGTGIYQTNASNNIDRYDYANGYCLYLFDLSQQHDQQGYQAEIKRGNTRLELKFAEALPESVTAIVYAKFPSTVQIDKARRVTIQ